MANGRAFTTREKSVIWERDHGICGICWRKADPDNWHADHIFPWVLGGLTTVENGQVSHPECNWAKASAAEYCDPGLVRNWRYWKTYRLW